MVKLTKFLENDQTNYCLVLLLAKMFSTKLLHIKIQLLSRTITTVLLLTCAN